MCAAISNASPPTHISPPLPPPPNYDEQETLKEMGEWAARYEMIAAMGYLAALLMVGKALHNLGKIAKVQRRRRGGGMRRSGLGGGELNSEKGCCVFLQDG